MHTPSSPVREREQKREREEWRERESEKQGEREMEMERWRDGEMERGRCRICPELLILFLKGMTGALAPFSYLGISESAGTAASI